MSLNPLWEEVTPQCGVQEEGHTFPVLFKSYSLGCSRNNPLWLLWLNEGYLYEYQSAIMDYMAHICMIIICITPHISVWLLTNSNQCECLAISVYVWKSEYVRTYVLHTK